MMINSREITSSCEFELAYPYAHTPAWSSSSPLQLTAISQCWTPAKIDENQINQPQIKHFIKTHSFSNT